MSYHFTDVVSFISRDQLIFFDPHGSFLPENMFGVRMNFIEVNLTKDTYKRRNNKYYFKG